MNYKNFTFDIKLQKMYYKAADRCFDQLENRNRNGIQIKVVSCEAVLNRFTCKIYWNKNRRTEKID